MDNALIKTVTSAELSQAIGLCHHGVVTDITSVKSIADSQKGCLSFSKSNLDSVEAGACVISENVRSFQSGSWIESANPRLDFALALDWLAREVGFAVSSEKPKIQQSVKIGIGCSIGPGVTIGDNTWVGNNVTIVAGATIGDNCIIKSGAVIGEDGFGFERDENLNPIRLVHLGSVKIGNNVEIGSLTTVCRGTLGDTVIEDNVKIDDHVHIAHNVLIRRGAMIIACAEISGGVEIEEFSWIGPNASIIQKVKVGSKSLIGIAANVIRDVESETIVAGNPAKPISKR